jgi:hypothetical protein
MNGLPNLFLVGAPKAGTTSLYRYLRDHPAVYMPVLKEPNFFGSDLRKHGRTLERSAYLHIFAEAGAATWVGEASVHSLQSELAAVEIKAFNPEARIVIALREPTEAMHSLHRHQVVSGVETILDFEEALAAEDDRRAGRRVPRSVRIEQGLWYRDTYRYAPQIRRFIDAFGRRQVHIIIFEQFRRDPAGVYRELLRFLELEDDRRESFASYNVSKQPRNAVLNRLVRHPPEPFRSMMRSLIPLEKRRAIGRRASRLLSKPEAREPMREALRRRLLQDSWTERQELEGLLGYSLDQWWGETAAIDASHPATKA